MPTPHGDKLVALLDNQKLPDTDKRCVLEAIERYKNWIGTLTNINGGLEVVPDMTYCLTSYKRYIDVELIFDSKDDFLYRQKGQLKLDNSIIEEFLPILVATVFADSLKDKQLYFGPTQCFLSLRFESKQLTLHSIKLYEDGVGRLSGSTLTRTAVLWQKVLTNQ